MVRISKARRFGVAAGSGVLVVGLLCAGGAGIATKAASGSTPVLTIAANYQSSFTDNFNPFSTFSSPAEVGAISLVYEPLLQFNTAKPLSAPYKWLASAFTWGAGGKSIVFTIRTGVKWSNGTPLTASDVAFTYNLLMKYPDINVYGLPLTGAVVSGNQVTVKFSTSEYANLQDVASVYIVPQSIWSNVGNPEAFSDPSPIGSGPYTLGTFVAGGFTLNANSTYWGGSPHVSEVDFPAIVTPSAMLTDLNTNQLDWA